MCYLVLLLIWSPLSRYPISYVMNDPTPRQLKWQPKSQELGVAAFVFPKTIMNAEGIHDYFVSQKVSQ